MIKIFKTFGGYSEIGELQKGCWINITNPTSTEVQKLTTDFGLPDYRSQGPLFILLSYPKNISQISSQAKLPLERNIF